MFEFLVLASLKSHAIVAGVALLAGGVGGFLFGGRVEAKAQAEFAKASGAVKAEAKKL